MIEFTAVNGPRDLLGLVVVSKRGRDKGKPAVVTGWLDGDFLLTADGKRRPLNKPKKKNMKHLFFTQYRLEGFGEGPMSGGRVTDRRIIEGLAAYGGWAGEGRPYGEKRCN